MPLLPHQVKPELDLLAVHKKHQASLDASDTGTGKTYVAAQMALDMGVRPLIVCPKSVISNWKRVCKEIGVDPLDVLNPEKIKTGKTKWLTKHSAKKFQWHVGPGDRVILFVDEAHGFGATDSQNAYALAYAKSAGLKVHMMSATLAESPLRLRAPGYLLDLHNFHDFKQWAFRHGCYRNPWNGIEFGKGPKAQQALKDIHEQVFPEYGVRITVANLLDFPATLIQPDAYDMDAIDEVNAAYEEAATPADDGTPPNALVALLRARQKTELLKCHLVFELAQEQLEEGHSVVVFVNFRETQSTLKQLFLGAGVACSEILGGQTQLERDDAIEAFQTNKRPVCLTMIQAGGVGISLHDLYGRPRTSIILPPLTARELKQALGRTHRAGSLSPALQKIVFAAGTVEEDVCDMVRRKLNNLDLLNDGDLSGGIL